MLIRGDEGNPWVIESLRALVLENTSGYDPWVQFDDGRAGILFCPVCGDLSCGAVSADVVFVGDSVQWRDVAYQDGLRGGLGTVEVPAFTVTFDRAVYEATVRELLARWS